MYPSITRIIRWGFVLVVLLMLASGVFLFLDMGVAALQGGTAPTPAQLDAFSFGLVLVTSLLAAVILFLGILPPVLDIFATLIKQRKETDIFP